MNAYEKRNQILMKLGFSSYWSYLQSLLWSSIRERVFVRKGRRCCVCGCPATQVHHRKYTRNNLSGKNLKHLFPICAKHHALVEMKPDGNKREFDKVQSMFNKVKAKPEKQKQINKVLTKTYKEIGFDQAMERWGI